MRLQLIKAIVEGERKRAAVLTAKEEAISSAVERQDEIIEVMLKSLPAKTSHSIEFGYNTIFFNEFGLPDWITQNRENVFMRIVPGITAALERLGIPSRIVDGAGPLVEVAVKDLYAFANYGKVNVIT